MTDIYNFAFLPNINSIEIFAILLFVLIWLLPTWMILKKAGYNPLCSLLILIPLVNLAFVFYIAFAKWPIQKEVEYLANRLAKDGK
jgi:hypothetical protein